MNESWSKHWHVLVYLVGLVWIGGMTFAQNEAQEEQLKEHEKALAEDDKRERADAVVQAVMQADIEDVKEDVDEIKDDVKEILKAVRDED